MEESLKAFEKIVKLSASNIEKVTSKFSITIEKCAKNFSTTMERCAKGFQAAVERGKARLAMLPGVVSRFGIMLKSAGSRMAPILKNMGKIAGPILKNALLNLALRLGTLGVRLGSIVGNIGSKLKNSLINLGPKLKLIANGARLSLGRVFENLGSRPNPPSNNPGGGAEDDILEDQEPNGFLSAFKGIGSKVFNLENAQKLAQLTIGGAMDEKKLKDMLTARAGGTGVFDTIKNDALKSGQDVNQALQNSLSFLSVTKNPGRLSKLNNFSERLNVIGAGGSNPEGAAEALKSLMTDGDTSTLAQNFSIPETLIAQSGIGDMGEINTGNIDEFISRFDQLMESANMGQDQFDQMLDDPAVKWQSILSNLKTQFANAGAGALQAISPVLNNLFAALQSGQFHPFFDMLGTGIQWIAYVAAQLADGILQIADYISSNWSTIGPIIWGIAGAVLFWNLAMKALSIGKAIVDGLKLAWQGLNNVMKGNIFILIVSLVVGLIIWLYQLWQTNDEFAAGLMRAWNNVLNFFDQVPIFLLTVWFSIVNSCEDMKVSVLKIIEDMINGVIDGINWLTGLSNKYLGTSIKIIDQVDLTTTAAAQAVADRQDRANQINMMEQQAAAKAAEREANVQKMLADRQAKRDEAQRNLNMSSNSTDDWQNSWKASDNSAAMFDNSSVGGDSVNSVGSVGSVGEIGKINDTVDISSEDLKTLRELAEMKNIQNFVTLTPTVAVQTGDIRHGEDANTLVDKIKTMLVTELASSAAGVYS